MTTLIHPSSLLNPGKLPLGTSAQLVKALALSLTLPADDTAPAPPVVYTTAIRSARQQTVSLAVSGLDSLDTFDTFQQVSSTLFGDC